MILSRKIRLLPTPEQEILLKKSAGTARWAYNYYIASREEAYNNYLQSEQSTPFRFYEGDLRKKITTELKPKTHVWLSEVSANVVKQAVRDANTAYIKFLTGKAGRPHYKKKGLCKDAFYVNYESITKTDNGFQGERLGCIKTTEPLPDLGNSKHYVNPRISYDGKFWYLSVGVEIFLPPQQLTNVSLGIDLGLKNLAILSNGMIYKNINKSDEMRRLKKKLKRLQRKAARSLLQYIDRYEITPKNGRKPIYNKNLKECKNLQKEYHAIKMLNKQITDIRMNFIHQTTTEIVKTKPSRVVMEDLCISGMMKNKHLAPQINGAGWRIFRKQMEYKCKLYGIKFVLADRFFPSSKTCSNCGYIKHDLKLKDRIFICPDCGQIIDRDLNASINLANYK